MLALPQQLKSRSEGAGRDLTPVDFGAHRFIQAIFQGEQRGLGPIDLREEQSCLTCACNTQARFRRPWNLRSSSSYKRRGARPCWSGETLKKRTARS